MLYWTPCMLYWTPCSLKLLMGRRKRMQILWFISVSREINLHLLRYKEIKKSLMFPFVYLEIPLATHTDYSDGWTKRELRYDASESITPSTRSYEKFKKEISQIKIGGSPGFSTVYFHRPIQKFRRISSGLKVRFKFHTAVIRVET
jgi:hypothetical protein